MNFFRTTLYAFASVKTRIDPLWSSFAVSLWLATVGNVALWAKLSHLPDLKGARGAWLMGVLGLAIATLAFAVQALFAGRWSTKVMGAILLLITAPAAYFMQAYGIVIDATMIKNTFQTDVKELLDLLSLGLVLAVLVIGVLPCICLFLRQHSTVSWGKRAMRNGVFTLLGLLITVGCLFTIKGDFATLMRNHTQVRYLITPFNIVYGVGRVAVGEAKAMPFESLGAASVEGATPAAMLVLALVVGETARADHFSLNGYGRPTNPALAQYDVLSFTQAWSCGTNTADSVPCMFSHLGRASFFDRKANYDNLLDVLQAAGYSVLWLDNNSGCKGVCARVPNEDLSAAKHPVHCASGECFDEILSHDLAARIQTMQKAKPSAKGVVVVMHQLGSHGPAYYKRSPASAKPFLPECKTNVLQSCDIASIVNAYDNSIAYTDRFLGTVIKQLKALPTGFAPSMVYMSDHGESLGEGGTYLHGLPYAIAPDSQKKVPLILWLSPAMQQQRGLQTDCLKGQINTALSHDHLFHSVLSLMRVSSASYKPSLDWFKPCL
jgi:lipid A ethanolaminephosphotransferase